jgi:hypothetical protein
MKVENKGRKTYEFVKAGGKVKDGAPEMVSIAPGETATLDVAESDLVRLHTILLYGDGDLVASTKDTERASAALARPSDAGAKPKPPQVI